ncbi:hypothetical protein D9M69_526690 [compost metagenome]
MTVREPRLQPVTLASPLVAVTVKVCPAPSVSIEPTGMPLIFRLRLSEPSVSVSAVVMADNFTLVPSAPVLSL